MKITRILAGILVGASLLSLASCGESVKESESKTESTSVSEKQSESVSKKTVAEIIAERKKQQERVLEIAKKNHEITMEELSEYISGITCWGDSLTAGAGGGGFTYAKELQRYINEEILAYYEPLAALDENYLYLAEEDGYDFSVNITVTNMGVGGETTPTILGRSGAVPYVLDKDITIPADTTPVEITFKSESGKQVDPLVQDEGGARGVNNVTINGVEGKLTIVKNTPGEIHIFHGLDKYYFTRLEAGESVTAAKGTEIEVAGKSHLSDFPIIYIGQNGGWNTTDELIEQIRALIGDHEEYIVMTSHHNVYASESTARETALKDAFGDNVIILREYMSSEQAIEDANEYFDADITPSTSDLYDMKYGKTPDCLRADGCHFNKVGYQLLARLLINRMEELGYFDTIREILDIEIEE